MQTTAPWVGSAEPAANPSLSGSEMSERAPRPQDNAAAIQIHTPRALLSPGLGYNGSHLGLWPQGSSSVPMTKLR